MDFISAINEGCYCLELKSETKPGVIEEMIDLLVDRGRIGPDQRGEALRAVLEREDKISTGLQKGVAVPHGKTEAIENLVTAVAFKKDGIDFEALDGDPSRIFVMTLSSPLRAGPHMEYLSEISKLLNSAAIRDRLLEAKTVDEVVQILITSCGPQNGKEDA